MNRSLISLVEDAEFYHDDWLGVILVELGLTNERAFMHSYSSEMHFMYMYSTLFSHIYLSIPFDKFKELNVAPPNCIWMLMGLFVPLGFYATSLS